ncbi:MAG: tRNA (N(6)-L-threonylcarbamoyladenosine(37)-C(2))-methylthiotransferase MtaB [Fusobacteriaceae bacterium]|jgi:threonylcarbamoyladenosine tRNA methylthiotransferase MtaB|nr:tRNA (N(6)-L-threonylcarbamoyladenosine(37)-C(2))-methylthiotransferase MtaB [Fusobacteriaceae bacterium]
MGLSKKAAFYTLGCKVNQYETESLKNQLINCGFTIVDFAEKADYYIVNTCTVTNIADRKSRNILRRAKKTNKDAVLIVTGCYAQTESAALYGMEEIDYIVGNTGKKNLIGLILERERPRERLHRDPIFSRKEYEEYPFASLREMSRAYIKIQDGCDQFCSYCKIPFARGRSRSRAKENILEEIRQMAGEGYREIILIGINLGAYGADLEGKENFTSLVREILDRDFIERVRIGSVYPDKIDGDFINLFSYPALMPHLHISLQSCDDTVLRKMRRNYGGQVIEEALGALKKAVPLLELTGDVIAGFPGETDRMFQNTCDLIEKIGFAGLHIFPYSDREGTFAATLPDKVPGPVKRNRVRRLEALKKILARRAREKYIGKELSVLIEEEKNGYYFGYSENYLKTAILSDEHDDGPSWINKIRKVRINSIEKEMLTSDG